jgi:hypothetical protein
MVGVFRKSPPEQLLSRGEVNGLIILLMSIDAGILRIAQAVEDEDGEEEEEDES